MTESKLRKLYPKKLLPPIEVVVKEKERRKNTLPKNPVIKFLYLYFGEGL